MRRQVLLLSNGQKITDKGVATEELRKIHKRVEREAAGLIDPFVEAASTPMRKVLADHIRHLRRKRCTRTHVEQVLCYVKWMIENVAIERLADFTSDRIDRGLGMIADKGRAPRASAH